jgi:hypothetical protein
MSNWFDKLDRLKGKLKALKTRLPKKDAKTINAALECLQRLGTVEGDLADLAQELEEIDTKYAKYGSMGLPDQLSELASSALTLTAISRFLRIYYWSTSLDRLQAALDQLAMGGPAALMLHPQKIKGRHGRRPDVPNIQSVKGALAGLMHQRQSAGMPRQKAAAWIADNISGKLASRISGKPITARMVEEWLDRYGGISSPDDAGGRTFKVWARPVLEPLSTKKEFYEMTERMARMFPARKT